MTRAAADNVDMEAKPFQPTTGTLIGRFEKQRWAGDRAEEIETVEFDATDYILNMSAAGLRKVEDCNYSSDAMAKLMWTTRAHFQFTSNKPSVSSLGSKPSPTLSQPTFAKPKLGLNHFRKNNTSLESVSIPTWIYPSRPSTHLRYRHWP